ncbi:YfkD family protein [Lentibacillus halophilus]
MKPWTYVIMALTVVLVCPISSAAEEKNDETSEEKSEVDVPSHVLTISKENTHPNVIEEQKVVEPSSLTKELIEDSDVTITNPDLIKMVNETSINPSPLAFGYRGMVYIGRWPLHYKSTDTTMNWEYQPINTNELNNLSGDSEKTLHYNQKEQKKVNGALTNKIANPHDIKKMMLLKAKEKVELPLAFSTVIGQNTKKDDPYRVPSKKLGKLQAYAPAVSEKGQVTFGEVYVQLKGHDKSIVVKNVTKQDIGAWVPVQDYISLSFQLQ